MRKPFKCKSNIQAALHRHLTLHLPQSSPRLIGWEDYNSIEMRDVSGKRNMTNTSALMISWSCGRDYKLYSAWVVFAYVETLKLGRCSQTSCVVFHA